jgi:thioredoxin 1
MSIIHFTKENYEELVGNGIVLVDFYAEWCGPCKMLAPALEALSKQREDIKIIKVNVDEQEDLAYHFGIMSVPTIYLYKDGAIVSKRSGFHTLDMLLEWINESTK